MENFLQQFVTAEENGELVYAGDELVVSETSEAEEDESTGDEGRLFPIQSDHNHQDRVAFGGMTKENEGQRPEEAVQKDVLLVSQQTLMPLSHEQECQSLDEEEEVRYLKRARVMAQSMQSADAEVQERLDAMKRILDIRDPMEQLSEYLAIILEERQEKDIEIVTELLHCAKHLPSDDAETALLAAFFLLCDGNRTHNRGMIAMLPVVAAMLEASGGVSHPF